MYKDKSKKKVQELVTVPKELPKKSCFDVLDFCDAQCCKFIVIDLKEKLKLSEFKGKYESRLPSNLSGREYEFIFPQDAEMQNYLEYHGFRFLSPVHAVIILKDNEAFLRGDKLYIYRKCTQLKNNKCMIYSTRPAPCNYKNKRYTIEHPRFCIYK